MDPREHDARLVRRFCENGDEGAFLELLERTERSVFLVALSVLGAGHEAEAEDVTQDVFIKAYTGLGRLREGRAFSSWIRRAAFNRAIDLHRRRRFEAPPLDSSASAPGIHDSETPLTHALGLDRDRRVQAGLQNLPPAYRSCLHLVYWLGCSVSETSEMLGLPEGTVKSHLHRARGRLRNLLEETPNVR